MHEVLVNVRGSLTSRLARDLMRGVEREENASVWVARSGNFSSYLLVIWILPAIDATLSSPCNLLLLHK